MNIAHLARTMPAALALATALLAGCGQSGDQTAPLADSGTWVQPRTEWGEPDLRGMWPIGHLTGTPLQRPAEFGERRYLTDEEVAAREGQYAARQGAYDQEIDQNKMGMGHWVEWGQVNRLTSLIIDPRTATPGPHRGRRAPSRAHAQRVDDGHPIRPLTDFTTGTAA
jgi:hypothetical protein